MEEPAGRRRYEFGSATGIFGYNRRALRAAVG
jgi:hypothetical protein